MLVGPWGTVLACGRDEVGVVVAELNLERQQRLRSVLPALVNRRPDVYGLALR